MNISLFSLLLAGYRIQLVSATIIAAIVVFFFLLLFMNRVLARRTRGNIRKSGVVNDLMRQALTISNNNVVRYDIREGYVYNYSGTFLPPRVPVSMSGNGVSIPTTWRQR